MSASESLHRLLSDKEAHPQDSGDEVISALVLAKVTGRGDPTWVCFRSPDLSDETELGLLLVHRKMLEKETLEGAM